MWHRSVCRTRIGRFRNSVDGSQEVRFKDEDILRRSDNEDGFGGGSITRWNGIEESRCSWWLCFWCHRGELLLYIDSGVHFKDLMILSQGDTISKESCNVELIGFRCHMLDDAIKCVAKQAGAYNNRSTQTFPNAKGRLFWFLENDVGFQFLNRSGGLVTLCAIWASKIVKSNVFWSENSFPWMPSLWNLSLVASYDMLARVHALHGGIGDPILAWVTMHHVCHHLIACVLTKF